MLFINFDSTSAEKGYWPPPGSVSLWLSGQQSEAHFTASGRVSPRQVEDSRRWITGARPVEPESVLWDLREAFVEPGAEKEFLQRLIDAFPRKQFGRVAIVAELALERAAQRLIETDWSARTGLGVFTSRQRGVRWLRSGELRAAGG